MRPQRRKRRERRERRECQGQYRYPQDHRNLRLEPHADLAGCVQLVPASATRRVPSHRVSRLLTSIEQKLKEIKLISPDTEKTVDGIFNKWGIKEESKYGAGRSSLIQIPSRTWANQLEHARNGSRIAGSFASTMQSCHCYC